MKIKFIFFLVLCWATLNTSFGQTATETEKYYNEATFAVSFNEHFKMAPEFTDYGQYCRVKLFPILGNINYAHGKLLFDDFRSVVDQIVPLKERGAKSEPFDKLWTIGGGVMYSTFTYEKVRITYSASFKLDPDIFNKSEDNNLLELSLFLEKEKENPAKAQDDFYHFHDSEVEFVTITWLYRKCAERQKPV